jgi:hypothetical protein
MMLCMSVALLPEQLRRQIVVCADGCWLWTGRLNRGYGEVKYGGRTQRVHRLVYELLVGPIVEQLDHLCRVRSCCNPAHLEDVPQRVNVLRGVSPSAEAARQTHCKYGHPFSGANLIVRPNGWRVCKACRARIKRERRAQGKGNAA